MGEAGRPLYNHVEGRMSVSISSRHPEHSPRMQPNLVIVVVCAFVQAALARIVDFPIDGGLTIGHADQQPCGVTFEHYAVQWSVLENDEIRFDIEQTNVDAWSAWWSGLGFGNGHNSGMDVICTIVTPASTIIWDRYTTDYSGSMNDGLQSLGDMSTSMANGVLRWSFTRPLVTDDNDMDRTIHDHGCQTFAFPYSGGEAKSNGSGIFKHAHTPLLLQVCDLRTNCRAPSTFATESITNDAVPSMSTTDVPTDAQLMNVNVDVLQEAYALQRETLEQMSRIGDLLERRVMESAGVRETMSMLVVVLVGMIAVY